MENPPWHLSRLGSPLSGPRHEPCWAQTLPVSPCQLSPWRGGSPTLRLLPDHLLEHTSGERHSLLQGLRPLPLYSSSGAARGLLRTSSTSAGLGGSACGNGADAAPQQGWADYGAGRSQGGAEGAGTSRDDKARSCCGTGGSRGGAIHIRATLGGRGRGARGRGGGARGRWRDQSTPRSRRCKQEHNGASGRRAAAKLGASAARLTGRPANGWRRATLGSQWARCEGGP